MKTANRFSSAILIIALVIGMSYHQADAANKIGYINLQMIVTESDAGRTARAEFNRIQEKMNSELRKRMQELEALNAQLQKERSKKPVDTKAIALVTERLQEKSKEQERLAADMREDLTKKDRELVLEILQRVAPIITDIAQSRGYQMIFKNAEDMAYIAPEADLTKEVIERLNRAAAGKK
jgi:outer membrane protein